MLPLPVRASTPAIDARPPCRRMSLRETEEVEASCSALRTRREDAWRLRGEGWEEGASVAV